jgi:hypothetical protein
MRTSPLKIQNTFYVGFQMSFYGFDTAVADVIIYCALQKQFEINTVDRC